MRLPPCVAAAAALLFIAGAGARAEVRPDPSLPPYQPTRGLDATVRATGDDDMEGLMRRWEALVKRTCPGLRLELDIGSSATAPAALASGKASLSFVGRSMLGPEAARVRKAWGFAAIPFVVAGGTFDDREKTHAEMVWVNPANPISSVTLAQLDAVYGEERRRGAARAVERWGDLGLSGEWRDKPVHVLRYKGSVGAARFFSDTALAGGAWRASATVLESVKDVPAAVAKDPYAIGIGGKGFAGGSAVKALPIARSEREIPVAPTPETVAARTYPLSRVVYFYVKKAPGQPLDPGVRELLSAALSKEGQAAALEDGYMPLPADAVRGQLARLADPGGPYLGFADNRIRGQRLVNAIVAENPDLLVIGLHGVPPGSGVSAVIASNLNRVGKKDDDDDVAAAKESKIICGPRLDAPNHFEVEMPLKDASNRVIGALSLIFPHQPGDERRLFSRSVSIQEKLAPQIPDFAALLDPED